MRAPAPLDQRIARLLVEQELRRGSGILKATRGKLRRLFCLEGGRLVFAASNVLEEQIEEVLKEKGLLDPAAHAALRESGIAGKRGCCALLLGRGLIREEDLRAALESRLEELLLSTMAWPDGAVEFAAGKPNVEGETPVSLSPVALVLSYARGPRQSLDAVRRRIGSPALVLRRAGGGAHPGTLDPVAGALLERCDGGTSVQELVASATAPEPESLRTLHGLLLAGLVEPAGQPSPRRDPRAGEPPLTREECLARLAAAESGDAYDVLGLDRGAPPEKVREAYYAIARRYHPDRFRSGPLRDLLPRFEEFFTSVTEAYNTLSDPDSRAEYERRAAIGDEAGAARAGDTARIARQNFLRGRALVERRRWTEATAFLENAVQLDPGQADYRLELGRLLARSFRRRSEAESHLRRAAELEPAKAAPHVALAQLFKLQGRWPEAFQAAREALRWEPDNAEARAVLAELREASQRPEADEGLRALFRR